MGRPAAVDPRGPVPAVPREAGSPEEVFRKERALVPVGDRRVVERHRRSFWHHRAFEMIVRY